MSRKPTLLDAETRAEFVATVERFVDDHYDAHARQLRLRAGPPDCRAHWAQLADLGLLSLPFGEEEGGLSGSALAIAEVTRALARGLIFEPYVEAAVATAPVLAAGRNSTVIEELLTGRNISVVVGARTAGVGSICAEKTDFGWRLDGKISATPYAADVDYWLIAARERASSDPVIFRVHRTALGQPEQTGTDSTASVEIPGTTDSRRAVNVEASHTVEALHSADNRPAVTVEPFRSMDGRPAADISFEGFGVPELSLWTRGDAASAALDAASLHTASARCADAVGCMAQLLTLTAEHLRTRVQFGVAIATFQALQHRYADMYMHFVEARAIAEIFARSIDEGSHERQSWLHYAATRTILRAAAILGHEAIQMHGAIGVTDELVVSHYNARLVCLSCLLRAAAPPCPTPLEVARSAGEV